MLLLKRKQVSTLEFNHHESPFFFLCCSSFCDFLEPSDQWWHFWSDQRNTETEVWDQELWHQTGSCFPTPGHPQPETWIWALPGLGERHIKHDCCQKVSTVLWNILTLTLFFLSLLLLLQPHISLTLENYDLVKIGAGLRSALKFSQWVSPFPKASHWSWHHFLP